MTELADHGILPMTVLLNHAVTILENFIKFPHRTIRNLLATTFSSFFDELRQVAKYWLINGSHEQEKCMQ